MTKLSLQLLNCSAAVLQEKNPADIWNN